MDRKRQNFRNVKVPIITRGQIYDNQVNLRRVQSLVELGVHISSPGLTLLVKSHLHFLQNFRGIADNKFDRSTRLKKRIICWDYLSKFIDEIFTCFKSSTAFSWCSPSTETPFTERSWSPRFKPPTLSATPPERSTNFDFCMMENKTTYYLGWFY